MAQRWSFGPFEFEPHEYRLVRSGEVVATQPKPLDLLALLLAAPGELLAREVLEAALYPDTTVTDTALRNVILKLREALGPEHAEWIETIPRRGVRFVGPVTVERAAQPAPGARTSWLPAERDRFFGRTTDREALARALAEARLVSLLGPGGVGKTRLVIHHCRARLDAWSGGVWFCDLSDAHSVDAVVSVVGSVLDVPLGNGDPVTRIGHAIATRGPCLVVLDNFEQLARHASELIGVWLDLAPDARFLVTTRELLQLPGEHVLDLAPLEVGDAALMFVERARAAGPRWIPPSEPGAVAALVEMLDALPLAIELAACRMRVMSLSALTARMGERFDLLKSTGGRPSRHATLRATLDDSWELLSEDERVALAQLSVFDGGFSLAAAEGVLVTGGAWPTDLVQALVDKSLVRFVSHERSTGGLVHRFELLVTVREYAAERLAERGAAAVELRHGAWFARFGAEACARFEAGPVLRPELSNLVIACRRAIARGDGPCAAATLEAVWAVVDERGPFALGVALADAVVAVSGAEDPRVLLVRAKAASAVGRTTDALTGSQAALAVAEPGSDRSMVVQIRMELGGTLIGLGRHEDARRELDAALAESRSGPYPQYEASILIRLGNLRRMTADTEGARAAYEAALAVARALGHGAAENAALGNLAVVLHHGLGRIAEGREHYLAALQLVRARGDRRLEGHVLGNLGVLEHDDGRMVEAGDWYDAALAIHRHLGNRREEGGVLGNRANWLLDRDRWAEARVAYEAALAIHREVGNRREEGIVLHNLSGLWSERDPARAEALLLEAVIIHREVRNRRFEGRVSYDLAVMRQRQGDLGGARAAVLAALDIDRETGNVSDLGRTLLQLGRVALDLGDVATVSEAVSEGIAVVRETGDRRSFAGLLALRAELEHRAGRPAEARTTLQVAEQTAKDLEDRELHAALSRARAKLSE